MSVAVRGAEAARLRLAELVAALSLGVDLGFGQPTEHVVRQCLIALRVADRIGLDEPQRLAVYYFALLLRSARSAARPMLRHLHGPRPSSPFAMPGRWSSAMSSSSAQ